MLDGCLEACPCQYARFLAHYPISGYSFDLSGSTHYIRYEHDMPYIYIQALSLNDPIYFVNNSLPRRFYPNYCMNFMDIIAERPRSINLFLFQHFFKIRSRCKNNILL